MDAQPTQQSLCLSCGFCCDGTLFGRVPLKADDILLPLQAGGIQIQTQGTDSFFGLPCTAHQQGCCQVYAGRPANCRKYRCELLKKYESGTVSWAEAQQKISRVRMLREMLMTELARVVPEDHRMSVVAVQKLAPAHKELAADPVLLKTWGQVLLRLSALLDCLQTHFQPPRQDRADS